MNSLFIKTCCFSEESQCAECGKGWITYKNSCYYISKERLSWQESRESCQKRGGDLVVIDNEIEQVNQSINQSVNQAKLNRHHCWRQVKGVYLTSMNFVFVTLEISE